MSKNKNRETKKKVLGSIASIQTLLERYPVLLTADSDNDGNGNVNVSISFLMALLGMLNVTQQDIAQWMARMLSGKFSDGVLNTIEAAVKAILLTNIKSLFTCSADPLISDNLLDSYTDTNGNPAKGQGLEINIDAADLMGILSFCPLSDEGRAFYFDNEVDNALIEGTGDLWKSRDFNAFLWYIINKSTTDNDKRKKVWDNRFRVFKNKKYKKEDDSFFNSEENDSVTKYFACSYIERNENITKPVNVITIHLNADRYRYKNINHTIFEFNYDFIYSLKLFDSKTLTAQIINAVLGLTSTVTGKMTIQQRVVEEKLHEVVKRVLETDDNEEENTDTDSYFKFSNDEYNALLEIATRKYNGTYQTGENSTTNIPFDVINENIEKISLSKTTEEESENIANALYEAAKSISDNTTRTDAKYDWGVAYSIETNLIKKFIEELSTQMVLALLSPKVSILYAINSYILKGNADDLSSWENFFATFGNLIKSIIVKIKDIIIQELYSFAMKQLKPLMELYTNKLLLETIRDYKDLLANLKRLCLTDGSSTSGIVHLIDNVNYADIITEKNEP